MKNYQNHLKSTFVLTLLLVFINLQAVFSQKNKIKLRIELSKNTIYKSEKIQIRWKAENVKKVLIEGINEEFPAEGSIELPFDGVNYYKFTAFKDKNDFIKRNVSPTFAKLKINRFYVSDTLVREGEKTYLNWEVAYATKIVIVGLKDSLPAVGRLEIQPDSPRNYKLIATVPAEWLSQEREIKVNIQYKEEFYASSGAVLLGDSVTLFWRYKGNKVLDIKEKTSTSLKTILEKPKSEGSYKIKMLDDKIFRITVEEPSGKVISRDISVGLRSPYVNISVKATPYNGFSHHLKWSSDLVKDVVVEDELGNILSKNIPRGGIGISPLITTDYLISGKDEKGQILKKTITQVVRTRPYTVSQKNYTQMEPNDRLIVEMMQFDKSNYPNEIKIKVLVSDTLGNFISGIADTQASKNKYFLGLVENIEGKSKKIQNFTVTESRQLISKPYIIGASLDYSGSMGKDIKGVENALKQLIENKDPNDLMAIVKFDHNLSLVVAPTLDKKEVYKKLKFNGLNDFGGGTALYAGIDEAIESIKDSPNKKMLVVVTDGQENSSLGYVGRRAFSPGQVVKKCRALGISVIVISYGNGTNMAVLKEMATLTDGYCYVADNEKEVEKIYTEIPRLFRNYYEISYKSEQTDGRRKVELSYYNNQKNTNTKTETHIGDKWDIDKIELSTGINARNGSNQPQTFTTKKPIAVPQVVANFEFNATNLQVQYLPNLNNLIEYLQKSPQTVIEIYGHTDMVGDDAKQKILSEQRANEVKAFLISKGIDPVRLATVGFGKTRPIWKNEQAPWQAHENRRIEVLILE